MRFWHSLSTQTLNTVLFGTLAIVGAVLMVLGFSQWVMRSPSSTTQEIAELLLLSGLITLIVGIVLYRLFSAQVRSIRIKIVLAYLLSVGIAFVNIYAGAQRMYISLHDFQFLSLLLIFGGIVSSAFGLIVASDIALSVARLAAGARALAAGNLSARVQIASGDELAALGSTFNRMANELQTSFARQAELEAARRDLIAAVSHDLRTPLASIRAMTEALADGVVSDEETTERYLTSIRREVEGLSTLIDDLFELAKLDSGYLNQGLQAEEISIPDLISDTLESMRPQAERKGVHLTGSGGAELAPVTGETQKIQRVLTNLISNAIRHTPADGTVSLAARATEEGVQVEVADTGEGIAPSDLPRVFERFYRGERSRSRATGGAGLGLAIAKGIVEAHGGRIWVESQPGRGTKFSFVLPRTSSGGNRLAG